MSCREVHTNKDLLGPNIFREGTSEQQVINRLHIEPAVGASQVRSVDPRHARASIVEMRLRCTLQKKKLTLGLPVTPREEPDRGSETFCSRDMVPNKLD